MFVKYDFFYGFFKTFKKLLICKNLLLHSWPFKLTSFELLEYSLTYERMIYKYLLKNSNCS